MNNSFRRLWITAILGLTVLAFAQRDDLTYQNAYRWDLQQMCAMDDLALWAGLRPGDLSIDSNSTDGKGCLRAAIDLSKGEYVWIEHNFIDGFGNVGEYLHGMNGHTEDFSLMQTIEFSFRCELNAAAELSFMIWDRRQRWCQWSLQLRAASSEWQTVRLSIPQGIGQEMDIARTGGITFQVTASASDINGVLYLDDLKFLQQPSKGIVRQKMPQPYTSYPHAIHSLPLPAKAGEHPVKILMFCGINNHLNEGEGDKAIAKLADSISRFRGMRNIEFWFYAGRFFFMEDMSLAEREVLSRKVYDATIQVAKWCQENQVPFYMGPGHITPLVIKADWMRDILDAAPTYCKGMFLHEFSPESNQPLAEMLDLLELMRQRNKVLILNNQTSYWFTLMWPDCSDYRNAMLDERYRDVFVPMWENLLPAAQGLCMGGAMGFWRAGFVKHWGVSTQSWGYANLNYGLTDQMPADWWLRMFVSTAALGVRYIEIEPDWPFNGHQLSTELQGDYLLKLDEQTVRGQWQDSPEMQALRWFDDLLTHKALLRPASPDHLVSLSPVTLQAANSENLGRTGFFERGLDIRFNQSHCPTYYEMAAQADRGNLFRSLYRSSVHYDQTFPQTPYGIAVILPMEARTNGWTVFKTDGFGAELEGQWKTADVAAPKVVQAFADASRQLPFTAEGCFISAAKLSEQDYQVVLMDAQERFVCGVKTHLQIRLPGRWAVVDAVSGKRLAVGRKTVPVQIEPAYIRILRIQKQ